MINGIKHFVLFFLVLMQAQAAFAQDQEVKTELSSRYIQMNEAFSIKVVIQNSKEYEVEGLPEIKGFKKNSKSIAHTQVQIQGRKVIQHTITQNYSPTVNGVFAVPAFDLVVNDRNYHIEEFSISVGDKPIVNSDFTEKTNINSKLISGVELNLTHSKPDIYVGEGVKITLGFYIPEFNTTPWEFLPAEELNKEIEKIARILKPKECLENRLSITNIEGTDLVIDDKKITFYKLFEAVYYPLNNLPIRFASVRLPMIKNLGENNSQKVDFKTKAVTISVKPLPEHPQKEKLAVGDFILKERIQSKTFNTGKSFDYSFKIIGDGNFNAINFEELSNDAHFDFFPPQIIQNQKNGSQLGEKEFIFKILPKDSGTYNLGNYFFWVYFNTKTMTYDTLTSSQLIEVSGEVITNNANTSGDLFDHIDLLKTSGINVNYRKIIKNIANVAVILMLLGMFYLIDFKRKK